MTKTFTIHGQTGRTRTQSRYVVVIGRVEAVEGRRWDYRTETYVPETYVPFGPEVVRRSDSIETARKVARQRADRRGPGVYVAVIDTTTGEEV
jgi:hypothetical protein